MKFALVERGRVGYDDRMKRVIAISICCAMFCVPRALHAQQHPRTDEEEIEQMTGNLENLEGQLNTLAAQQQTANAQQAAERGSVTVSRPLDVESLPAPNFVLRRETHELQSLQQKVNGALHDACPESPPGASMEAMNAWASTTLATWRSERKKAVRECSTALEAIAESHAIDRTIGAAYVGALEYNTAQCLSRMEAPTEIQSNPGMAAMFTRTLEEPVREFAAKAKTHFEQCARTSRGVAAVARVHMYCSRGAGAAARVVEPNSESE